ncbi:MAG: hypothetical protein M0016_01260 [Deltaproteobacteria bacterium]|jgi:hypothetical protein|nr:hypothetical protein [Deltaproteobacteria bacterium]MCL5880838.1 hypothetical protein [Deltaproteobacteria bacterium]MDA8303778.1 hypothetical protein [Deltaproteobacteria bacterium]
MRAILKKEATKKFIENEIKKLLGGSIKVLKRNPGHISLAEVERMPDERLAREISKYCREKMQCYFRLNCCQAITYKQYANE